MNLFALDDTACQRLADTYGTPLFIYHSKTAERQFRTLRAVLPERVVLAYAVKANPHESLLRCFAELGAGFDCASIGELQRVRNLGISGDRVLFAGPGKRQEEIAFALQMGARLNAESWEDLCAIQHLATKPVIVNLRVHPIAGAEEGSRIIGGVGPSVFGVDEEQLADFLRRATTLSRVRIAGLHVFAASNQRDANILLATYRMVVSIAQRIQKEHGVMLEQIDLGGGLGVPYNEAETELDIVRLGAGLAEIQAENSWFTGKLIIEPGRYLAAPCGVYLAKVVRVKESRGVRFAILEGGINHLLRPFLTGQAFPVRAVGKKGEPIGYTLAGPLCTSLDRLGEVQLPELTAGDLLAFGMTGAYGYTEGMTHFLSHPLPKEIWFED